ncbi:MAG TPA: FtsX-like permease family protein [Polyangia bacterium]|jgi:ABC-type lipoprotein release transport system permease subunit
MQGRIATLGVIAKIAFRNLFASRLKTIIVGGIILFGAFLVVVGGSFVDSMVTGMRRSIVGSVAGHIQVYSARSKDPLEVMGGFSLEAPDLAALDDFAKVKQVLQTIPGVKAVVPMGVNGAIVPSGNTIDVALAHLRELVRRKLSGKATADDLAAYDAEKGHVHQILSVLQGDIKNARQLQDEKALSPEDAAAVNKAISPAFWASFDKDPLDSLEFLENRIAPQAIDADMLFLRYVGTDPAVFARSFDRMKIVDGTTIPEGKRGFLFAKFVYEDQVKLKTARRLDKIKVARNERGEKIAKEAELKRFVRENSNQVREILLQLDQPKTALFRAKLQAKLGSAETDVAKLLSAFFQTDDANFDDRYQFFYKELAPSLELYRIRIGDTLTIKAFTRSGYVQSVNVPVYGTFDFTGLEKSPQAGALNLMDMVSFRDLYGFLTAEREKEIGELKKAMNAREISRDNAEAELFGVKETTTPEVVAAPAPALATGKPGKHHKGAKMKVTTAAALEPTGRTIVAEATPGLHPPEGEGIASKLTREELVKRVYDPEQLESGSVLNAAVILDDESKIPQTIVAIEAAGAKAGLPLKAITWQQASGFIGQLVVAFQAVLVVLVLIIFLVALVIISNALVMATLQRVQEIGTLRAVGAQRRFILIMLLLEALVVAVVFGGAGVILGAITVSIIGKIGIPAPNDVSYFFFSGPRLHLTLGTANLVAALVIVFVVSGLSSLYPAWLAMRVNPRTAMQSEEG